MTMGNRVRLCGSVFELGWGSNGFGYGNVVFIPMFAHPRRTGRRPRRVGLRREVFRIIPTSLH